MLQPEEAVSPDAAGPPAPANDGAEPPAVEALWSDLAASRDQAELGRLWLTLQCRTLPDIGRGLLMLASDAPGEEGVCRSIHWPAWTPARAPARAPAHAPSDAHLVRAAQRSLADGEEVVFWAREEGAGAVGIVAALPIRRADRIVGAVAFLVESRAGFNLPRMKEQILWGAGWLETLALRRDGQAARERLNRTGLVLDLLAAAGEHRGLDGTCLALANELAVHLGCRRVAIGLKRPGGGLRLRTVSHAASVRRRSRVARTIENAMDEALDQSATIAVPEPQGSRYLTRAHRALAAAAGSAATASVVLTWQGQAFGALTVEREARYFTAGELEFCEAVAALIAPLLAAQGRNDRWFSGRLVDAGGAVLHKLLGRHHLALKLGTAVSAAALLALAVADGEHRISAKTVLEGSIQRAAVVPFDGFVAQAPRRAGDVVREGEVLAVLDDKDLVLDRARSVGESAKLQQKYSEALAKHDRVAMGVLQSQIAQARAQLDLTEEKLARSRIRAPFDGIVVSGDFTQMIGSPVEKGKLLFEVAPLHGYRAVIQVDERDVRYVAEGQTGRLALAADPNAPLPFTVTRVTPIASAEDGHNAFRVEAALAEPRTGALRPGLEGIAKIEAGSRSLLWIWTHALVDWMRLTAWKWLW